MKLFSKEDVLEKAREYNVKFIRLQFTSILGALKNIAITVEQLPAALEGRVMFDSSVIEGFVGSRESDIYLYPDPSTFVIFPWRPREGAVARLICDAMNPDGTPYGGCCRAALERVMESARSMGYGMRVATEIEFYLFHAGEQGTPSIETHDRAGYCDLTPVDRGENARRDIVLTLEEMGFDVSTSYHEIGPGQHEIFLKDSHLLTAADDIATFKFVVRTVANRHGLHATFMPRPLDGRNGSGMTLHISLFQGDRNIFSGKALKDDLGREAAGFMGGLMKHAWPLTAVTNPLVNSYKRITSGGTAPLLAAWSRQNRLTMLRVPAGREGEASILLRNPDSACNPYLALAAILQCGLDGMINSISPGAALEDNELSPALLKELIRQQGLPRHLDEALGALSGSKTVREALGHYISNRYIELKEEEWERYISTVHRWELEEYLANY